jgi:hypothetical protein
MGSRWHDDRVRRLLLCWAAVALLAAACSEAEPTSTTVPLGTTTTAATTSIPPSTTTTTLPVVLEHPNLPSAEPISAVDWADVGPGWHLVSVDGLDIATATDGPSRLYLVSPDGARFQVPATMARVATTILDWASHEALLLASAGTGSQVRVLDLITGRETVAYEVLAVDHRSRLASFLWTGSEYDVLLFSDDGDTQRIERLDRTGARVAIIAEQATPADYRDSLAFQPGNEVIAVATAEGMSILALDGSPAADLWSPEGRCAPVRWWDDDTVLAVCDQPPPNDSYGRLWLLPADGTAGTALTAAPTGAAEVVDFGYRDAWAAGDDMFLQWRGDCGSARIEVASSGEPLIEVATEGVALVDVVGDVVYVHGWGACDASEGRFSSHDLTGAVIAELVPRSGTGFGVADVAPYR